MAAGTLRPPQRPNFNSLILLLLVAMAQLLGYFFTSPADLLLPMRQLPRSPLEARAIESAIIVGMR